MNFIADYMRAAYMSYTNGHAVSSLFFLTSVVRRENDRSSQIAYMRCDERMNCLLHGGLLHLKVRQLGFQTLHAGKIGNLLIVYFCQCSPAKDITLVTRYTVIL